MKIVTWNTLASEWMKKSYYPDTGAGVLFNRKARFEQLIKILRECDADVIMLQEVMKKEYSLLKKLFAEVYIVSKLKKMNWYNKESESGNVTILRRSLFPAAEVMHEPHEYGLHTQCMYKGNMCDIFNIHLDDASIQTRYKQWNDLNSKCRPNCRVIVGGDFNHQYKKNSRLYNAPGFTAHNLCPTYYIERKMNIDNIMTKGFKKVQGNTCSWYPEKIEDGFHVYGSDHIPVFIELDLERS